MLAGIDKIPAIVKENLSDEDAIVYVIETNMIQRSFSELLPSEKAAVLAVRYEKISSQGKRSDILQEIEALNGQEGTCGHDVHKSRSRDELGNEYGMTGRNIARYMRVDKLSLNLKRNWIMAHCPWWRLWICLIYRRKSRRLWRPQCQRIR